MDGINWDHFPEPYNRELPFYIDKALRSLSSEGVEMLNMLLDNTRRLTTGEGAMPQPDPDVLAAQLEQLPPFDFQAIIALTKHLKKATEAVIEEAEGEIGLFRQLQALHDRARKLDPTLPAEATLQEPGPPAGPTGEGAVWGVGGEFAWGGGPPQGRGDVRDRLPTDPFR